MHVRRGRTGGLGTVAVAALAHASAHVAVAVFSVVLLELGVETCIRCALLPFVSDLIHPMAPARALHCLHLASCILQASCPLHIGAILRRAPDTLACTHHACCKRARGGALFLSQGPAHY